VKYGKKTGIKSNDSSEERSRECRSRGNQFGYVRREIRKTMQQIQARRGKQANGRRTSASFNKLMSMNNQSAVRLQCFANGMDGDGPRSRGQASEQAACLVPGRWWGIAAIASSKLCEGAPTAKTKRGQQQLEQMMPPNINGQREGNTTGDITPGMIENHYWHKRRAGARVCGGGTYQITRWATTRLAALRGIHG